MKRGALETERLPLWLNQPVLGRGDVASFETWDPHNGLVRHWDQVAWNPFHFSLVVQHHLVSATVMRGEPYRDGRTRVVMPSTKRAPRTARGHVSAPAPGERRRAAWVALMRTSLKPRATLLPRGQDTCPPRLRRRALPYT